MPLFDEADLTPEVKHRILSGRGLDPNAYDILTDGSVVSKSGYSPPAPNASTDLLKKANTDVRGPSSLESFGRSAAESALPTATGLGAAAIGGLLAPETGGLSLLIPILAGLGGSMAGSALQNKVVPQSVKQQLFSRPEDVQQNPVASFAGGLAPSALAFNPAKSLANVPTMLRGAGKLVSPTGVATAGRSALTSAEEAMLANAAINTAVAGGQEAYDYSQGQPVSLARFAGNAIAPSLLMTSPTRLGRAMGFHDPAQQGFDPRSALVTQETAPPTAQPVANVPMQQPHQFGIQRGGALFTPEGGYVGEAGVPIKKTNLSGEETTALSGEASSPAVPAKSAPASAEIIKQGDRGLDYQMALREKAKQDAQAEYEAAKAAATKEILGTQVARPEVRPKPLATTELGKEIMADYTGVTEHDRAALAAEPKETQAEYEQRQYEEGKRRQDVSAIHPEVDARLKALEDEQAARRGIALERNATISSLGEMNQATRTAKLGPKAAPDTASHEVLGHGYLGDLLRSGSPRDNELAIRGIREFSGRKDIKSANDFLLLPDKEQATIEEHFAQAVGAESYGRKQTELYGTKLARLKQTYGDIAAHVKTKLGLAGPEDILRHYGARGTYDAPYGSRNELAPRGVEVSPAAGVRRQEDKPTFELQANKELRGEKPFGVPIGKDGSLPGNAVLERLSKTLPPAELEILHKSGIGKYLAYQRRTPAEINQWIKDNGPKVEVKKFGEGAGKSEDEKALNTLQHEWYDNTPFQVRDSIDRFVREYKTDPESADTTSWYNQAWQDYKEMATPPIYTSHEFSRNAEQYARLSASVNPRGWGEISSGANWSSIAPKPESKMPGYVEIAITLPHKTDRMGTTKSESIQFGSSHNFPPNTLGFGRGYMETLPNGEKAFHLIEAQSDWGQMVREYRQKFPENSKQETIGGGIKDNPLLKDYNRLIIKAAIDHARKEGATKLIISDAETAMMSEGHDLNVMHAGSAGMQEIRQEPGMRLNYDQILPKIASELTGSEGHRVSLGEHKNGVDYNAEREARRWTPSLTESEVAAEVAKNRYRKNLIFKDENGLPKTDVSGRIYDISNVKQEPFTLHGKRFQTESALKEEPNKVEPIGKTSFIPALTARIDKIAEAAPESSTHQEVATKLLRTHDEADLLKGRIGNRLIAQTAGYTPEEVQREYQYSHAKSTGQEEPFLLTPREKELKGKIDKIMKESGELFQKEGPDIKTASGDYRKMLLKDTYRPSIVDQAVVHAWHNNTPEAKAYDKAYLDYMTKEKNVPEEQAKQQLQDYKQAIGNKGITPDVKFGALTKQEGYGLPWELVDKNFTSASRRYGDRAATTLSYFKNIQNDPRMLKALGLKDQYGKRIEDMTPEEQAKVKDVEWIGGHPTVQAAMRSIYGIDVPPNPKLQSAIRVAGSIIMQTGTAARNLLQLPATVAPYYGVDISTGLKALAKMNERAGRAFENNATHASYKDFDAAGDFEGSPDKFVRLADKFVTLARKWSGRELSDKWEGQFTYSLGEELATKWFAAAKDGDIKARAMLQRFGTTLDGKLADRFTKSGAVTQDDVGRVAKQFVNAARGTYGPGGLPSVAIEGNITPLLSLSRWSIERSNIFYKDVIRPLTDHGDWMPLLKTTLTTLVSGAAIEKLNELLSNKKGNDPTIAETLKEATPENLTAKAIGLAQLGSFAGIIGDAMKVGANLYQGKDTKFSNPISFPAGTLAEDMVTKTGNMWQAIHDGEDPFAVLAQYMGDILKSSQNARYLEGYANADETKRKEKYRDMRTFEELSGLKNPQPFSPSNPYESLEAKKFKRTADLGEAANMAGDLVDRAVKESTDSKGNFNIEQFKEKLKSLRGNNAQTFPDFQRTPQTASSYYDYLRATQGEEAANNRLSDYYIQKQINSAKSRLIPSL